MAFPLVLILSLALRTRADDITPDWHKLTDFSTSTTFDLAPVIAFAHAVEEKQVNRCVEECKEYGDSGFQQCYDMHCARPAFPLKSESGSGTIQLDVLGERFKMTANVQEELTHSSDLPPPLQGAKVSAAGSIAFDATAGMVVLKHKGSVTSASAPGPFGFELCAKVNFPKGLLPPGQAIMAQLDQAKPQIEQMLKMMPHKEVTVDGASVALYEKPGNRQCVKYDFDTCNLDDASPTYCPVCSTDGLCMSEGCMRSGACTRGRSVPCLESFKSAPDMFVGLLHDATPVGLGIKSPADGKWDSAVMKFSDWTTGAGTIEEESCVTMSATELLQSHHANRTLWVFDQLMSQLKRTEPLSAALAFIPTQPSQIFASAAKLESIKVGAPSFNEAAEVPISSPSAWVTMAMAAVGGVVGAGFVLALSKRRRASVQDFALLA